MFKRKFDRDSHVSPYTPAPPYQESSRVVEMEEAYHRKTSLPDLNEEELWESTPEDLQGSLNLEETQAVIGEGLSIKGTIAFERSIRIDGSFEGEIISQGNIHIGPTGIVKANLNLNRVIVQGEVHGNIVVEELLEVACDAKVIGNVQAKRLRIEEGATMIGQVSVKPGDSQ